MFINCREIDYKRVATLKKKSNVTFVKKMAIGLILALRNLIPMVTNWERIFGTSTKKLWAIY